jgi:hypothetical protein
MAKGAEIQMMRLETSRGRGIDNDQTSELTNADSFADVRADRQFPGAIRRTPASASYNCHGMTFAARRTRIWLSRALQMILADDGWTTVNQSEALPGDVVIYRSDDGDLSHSGVVVESDPLAPLILSKWGNGGERVHRLRECPSVYGPQVTFYRCLR